MPRAAGEGVHDEAQLVVETLGGLCGEAQVVNGVAGIAGLLAQQLRQIGELLTDVGQVGQLGARGQQRQVHLSGGQRLGGAVVNLAGQSLSLEGDGVVAHLVAAMLAAHRRECVAVVDRHGRPFAAGIPTAHSSENRVGVRVPGRLAFRP